MKKVSNTETELKKSVAYKKSLFDRELPIHVMVVSALETATGGIL